LGKLKRSKRNIQWLEEHCVIPEGKDVGIPLVLRPWQKKILVQMYDTPTRRIIISVGRKNAKTALSAMIMLLHLCGPEAKVNSQLYSSALSRDQAAIIYNLASKMVKMSTTLREFVTTRDTLKELYCSEIGTLYKALSADAATQFGLSPVLVIHDELGQVKGPMHPLYEALETATGAQQEPLSIIISTQAATDGDLLSILIDDAKENHDKETKLVLFSADMKADPFSVETVKAANPAFGDFQNAKETMAMAEAARRMPSREAQFRNLVLNQRVEAANPFVNQTVWASNGKTPDKNAEIWFGGLDLSEINDLTAFILVSPAGDVDSTFWLPQEGLTEKSRLDRVPYDVWAKNGFLMTTPGKSIQYEYVAKYLYKILQEKNIRKIAFDRWNMRHLRPWLIQAGLSETFIDSRFVDFGQGYQSMSPALRTLETLLLDERLKHGGQPVLTMCAANSVIKMDEAGSRKLDKRKSRGRIDGMVALAMATAVMAEDQHDKPVYPVDLEDMLV
tara:strand:- start:2589 stop:4103 length:1515 start_codon:yes stop_codon:yes gene_type:complete